MKHATTWLMAFRYGFRHDRPGCKQAAEEIQGLTLRRRAQEHDAPQEALLPQQAMHHEEQGGQLDAAVEVELIDDQSLKALQAAQDLEARAIEQGEHEEESIGGRQEQQRLLLVAEELGQGLPLAGLVPEPPELLQGLALHPDEHRLGTPVGVSVPLPVGRQLVVRHPQPLQQTADAPLLVLGQRVGGIDEDGRLAVVENRKCRRLRLAAASGRYHEQCLMLPPSIIQLGLVRVRQHAWQRSRVRGMRHLGERERLNCNHTSSERPIRRLGTWTTSRPATKNQSSSIVAPSRTRFGGTLIGQNARTVPPTSSGLTRWVGVSVRRARRPSESSR